MASIPKTTRQWVIKKKPADEKLTEEHFILRNDVPLFDGPTDGKILVKILFISNDPAQRTWMDDGPFNTRSYLPPVMREGATVFAGTVGEVLQSFTPEFSQGDVVFGHFGWTEYALVNPTEGIPVQKIPADVTPEDFHCMELTGQSAYFAFFRQGEPTKEMKTVVINSAAGAIGSLAIQFAKKIVGIDTVIGVCGSEEKCETVKKCGADIALNYNSPQFEAEFIAATPDYIDLFFDNVGGTQLDLAVQRIANKGRIVACGAISAYEREQRGAISAASWMQIIYRQATIVGFLVLNFWPESATAVKDLTQWAKDGKIEFLKTVHEVPIEGVPQSFFSILNSKNSNVGKTLTKLKW